MSGMLSKAIRSNLLNQNTKYKNDQEKVGEVISTDEATNSCTVSLISRDGIGQTVYNVKVQVTDTTLGNKWFPEKGDYVKVTEKFKRYVIIGSFDFAEAAAIEEMTYDDIYADITGSGGGYIGY